MNLQRKLLTIFSGLALLAVTTAGVTVWAIAQWQASNKQLEGHYQRSLLVQRIRAAVFRAFKEVPDAVTGGDLDARQEFQEALKPVEQDFKRWAELADEVEAEANASKKLVDTDDDDDDDDEDDRKNTQLLTEKQQLQQIRNTYDQLVTQAYRVFDLVEADRRKEAFALLEGKLEDEQFQSFQTLTERAVASDQDYRQVVQSQVAKTMQTAEIVLAIAAFATISLMLLLAAYLASDLFAPLREVKTALDDVARGDLKRRLEEERTDELGAIHQAFNSMVEAMGERQQVAELAAVPTGVVGEQEDNSNWQNLPSRLTLHRLVTQLRSRVTQLNQNDLVNQSSQAIVAQKQALVDQLDLLLQAVARMTDFGFPLDLNLARTDIRSLLYEVIQRFQDEFVERGISIELDIQPEVKYAVIDRLKIREVLSELVRNALAALPEQGGRLGIRTSLAADGTELSIEVADNGKGIKQPLIERAFATANTLEGEQTGVGLPLTKAIVEQHGGKLTINSEPGQGTYVLMQLPLLEAQP